MRFRLPRLIGITGRAGSGKDTLADYLVNQHGFIKYSLAKPLKNILNARFGWTEKHWLDRAWKEQPDRRMGLGPPPDCVPFSPRSWAQWLGTEVGRTVGGTDVWVNLMEREWRDITRINNETFGPLACMVVPDVRFDNEAERIHLLGGVVLRVLRHDSAAVPPHASERGVRDELVNIQVANNTDIITYLREAVYALEGCPRGA